MNRERVKASLKRRKIAGVTVHDVTCAACVGGAESIFTWSAGGRVFSTRIELSGCVENADPSVVADGLFSEFEKQVKRVHYV